MRLQRGQCEYNRSPRLFGNCEGGNVPKVSVLVPIYNVEPFLRQCIESLLGQSCADIEIILLDDGSTDGGAAIVDEYGRHDARIQIVHKTNSGYGDSLNQGLSLAKGEWISIVEPDDWAEPTMMERLLAEAEAAEVSGRRIDIVKGSYRRVIADASGLTRCEESVLSEVVNPPHQPFSLDECPDFLYLHPSIWSALYRREFLDEFDIRFEPIPGAGWADNPFFIETMVAARSIVFLREPVYNYREFEDGTISHLKDWRVIIDRWADMLDVLERYDVHIPAVLEAHYCRGCAYLQMIRWDFEQTDELVQAARAMAATIDLDQVRRSSLIPKEYKSAYAHYLSMGDGAKLLGGWIAMQVRGRMRRTVS